eukprot:m.62410 g.62410  ORF g.62410 m.62410 type:complete len:53 (-) comp11908_c0_seq4:874-1032(-)
MPSSLNHATTPPQQNQPKTKYRHLQMIGNHVQEACIAEQSKRTSPRTYAFVA